MRTLFKTIESFLQVTNMIGKVQINIPRWLFRIDIFSENIIEECIINIKLTNGPIFGHSNRKHNMNSDSLDNVTKSVGVVETKYLNIAFGNKSDSETFNRAIK